MGRTGDGTNDLIKHTTSVTISASFTVSLWYRNASAPGSAVNDQFFTWNSSSDRGMGASWDHANASFRGAFFTANETSGNFSAFTLGALSADTWYQLLFTFTGTTGTAYKDGTQTAQDTSAEVPTDTNETIQALAGSGGSASFDDGTIDEIGVWDVVLDADDIAALAYLSPRLIRPDDQVLCWSQMGTLSPEKDYSGNGRDGTVTGAVEGLYPPVIHPSGGKLLIPAAVAGGISMPLRVQYEGLFVGVR